MVNLARAQRPRAAAAVRILLYAAGIGGAAVVADVLRPPGVGVAYRLGLGAALVGFSILAMQVVVAARLKWGEWPFGMGAVMRFHKAMALVGVLLLMMHPVLLAIGSDASVVLPDRMPWHLLLGPTAIGLLMLNWTLSQFRQTLDFEFQKWRWSHNILGLAILACAFLHSYFTGGDLASPVMRVAWPAAIGVIGLAYLYHRAFRPLALRRNAWKVVQVKAETYAVTTVALEPPAGVPRFDYWPGQFHFLTFHRQDKSLPTEEHHWTISSSPTQPGIVTSTIKASGDFTATMPRTRVGDTAQVLGPYGRFSYVLHPGEGDLGLVAGGIGITPLMAMIRHMHDTGDPRRVLLVYANRAERDIVFREELDALAASGRPALTVVHVLDHADDSWTGLRGRVDEALLRRHYPDAAARAFYVCGPPAMSDGVIRALRKMGVARRAIHSERFSL